MSKFIDADRLRAEIVRLKKEKPFHDDPSFLSYRHGLSKIEDFIDSLQQEQPEVDYSEFEKLFDDYCERNKGHHITSHDACMWFWELGINARKEENK